MRRPLLLLVAAAAPVWANAQQLAATVTAVRGEVTIGPPGDPGRPVADGDALPAGQVLTTGADGGAVLAVADGGRAEIGPGAAFAFYDYAPGGVRYLAALARGQFVFDPPFDAFPDLACSVLPPQGPGVPFEATNVKITMSPGEKPYAVACVRGAPPAGFVQADARFGRPAPPPLALDLAQDLGVRPLGGAPAPTAGAPPALAPPSPDVVAGDGGLGVGVADDAFDGLGAPPLAEIGAPPVSGPGASGDLLARNRAVLGIANADVDAALAADMGPDAPPLAPPPLSDPVAEETAQLRERIAELEALVDGGAATGAATGGGLDGLGFDSNPPPLITGDALVADAGGADAPFGSLGADAPFDNLGADGPPLQRPAAGAIRGPDGLQIGRAQSDFTPGDGLAALAATLTGGDAPLLIAAPGDARFTVGAGPSGAGAPTLSAAAALRIGRARAHFPAPPPRPAAAAPAARPTPPSPPAVSDGAFRIQVGAFGDPANAARMEARLKNAGFSPFIRSAGDLDLVFAGAANDASGAARIAQAAQAALGGDAIVVRR